jgi:chromatin assembly factor 1 subunit B
MLPQVTRLTEKQLWKIEANGEERKVTYLSSLVKHTQAVNVVRWCPRGRIAIHF